MLEFNGLVIAVLVLAVIAGLPHGAFDVYIAHRLGIWRTPLQLSMWLLRYLLLSAAVIGLWIITPMLSLIVFLLISALHFGRDYFPTNHIMATSLGLVILGLPMLGHGNTVALIFSYLLLPMQHAEQLVWLFSLLAIIAAVVLVAAAFTGAVGQAFGYSVARWKLHPKTGLGKYGVFLVVLTVAAYIFHPLIYFALYFSLSHSPLHLREQWRAIAPAKRNAALGVLTILTLVPVMAAFLFGTTMAGAWSERVIALVFIGLAALTMPHMLLLEKLYREKKRNYG